MTSETVGAGDRRLEVLDAALHTFARFGYRKTAMDEVAKQARISRPGLYFLFSSKSGLFRAAAERGIELDLAAAELALAESGLPLGERIVEAFDCWAGRYVGPLHDTTALIADNPGLVGPIAIAGPARFERLITDALTPTRSPAESIVVARTLISVSIGIKHQSTNREEYRYRMTDAVRLLVPAG